MTRQDLEQIYYLKLDIKRIEARIAEKRSIAESSTQVLSLTAGAGGSSDAKSKQERFIDKANDDFIKLNKRQEELRCKVRQAEEFIDTVADPRMRCILEYRCIKNLQWSDVATRLGGHNTSDSVRKAYNRFMDNLPKK